MALLLAYQLRKRGFVTLGDFFRARCGRPVEVFAVVILVPASIIWAAAQLLALGQFLVVVSGIDLDVALTTAMVLVITYTVMGGLLGDVVTGVLQGGVLIVGLIILLVLVLGASGGLEAGLARIEARQLSFIDPTEGALARLDVWMVPVIGSLVSHNLIKPLRPEAGDRWRLGAARLTVAAAGIVAYFIARGGGTIYDLMRTASSFGTAGVAVTVVLGLWLKCGGMATAVATLAVGAAGTLFGEHVFGLEAPFKTSLALSLATFLALCLIDRGDEPPRAGA